MRAAVLVLALVAIPGCLSLDALPERPDDFTGGGTCPPIPQAFVQVVLQDAPAALHEVVFRGESAYRVMLSCVAPPEDDALPANSSATAGGWIVANRYEEVRLVFHDRVVRAALDVPATTNGTLRLRVGAVAAGDVAQQAGVTEPPSDPFRAWWNGTPLEVHAVERLAHPDALDDHVRHFSTFHLTNATYSDVFVVNSSWNRGAFMSIGMTGDSSLVGEGPEAAEGARVEAWLKDAEGAVLAHETVTDPFGHRDFASGPLEPGEYAFEVRTTGPESGVRISGGVSVRFLY